MDKRMIIRLFLVIAVIVAIIACAKISSPSGGMRDRTPPVVVKSIPVNGAKNFKGKKIEIEFDEYVVLDNINEKFMVSPPMKKKPKISIRGKAIEVEFDDKLKDSTTYTFYFRDAIKDLNEGNILKNYQFVLSTGPVIDSLSVTGNVYNAFNLEAPEKTEVLLYRELADSAVKKHLPEYISSVDQSGYFRFDNVRPGTYRLYGLKDIDNSKNYNLADEEFAFMDSTILITPAKNFIPPPHINIDSLALKKGEAKDHQTAKKGQAKAPQPVKKGINKNAAATKDTTNLKKNTKVAEPVALTGEYRLFQFTALKKTHYLISSHRDHKYELVYILSLPPDTMKFDFSIPGADRKAYFTEYSRNRDTLKVWLADSTLYSKSIDSSIVKYPFTDTLGITRYKQDTILMRFTAPRAPKVTKVKRIVFTLENNIQTGFLKPGQTIVFRSKTPFSQPDTSKIKLYEVVQTNKQKLPYQLVKDSVNSCKYYLKAKLAQGKKYFFIADKASFTNIYNEYSDSVGIKFSIKDPDSYCKLTMDIKNYKGDRIIQLLDKSEKLIAETYMNKDGKVVFSLLESGFYRLKVIYDLNGDKKWTTGDFTTHRQPEPVSYYPAEIELRPGFELEFTNDHAWDIGVKNVKDTKLRESKKGK
jgi:Bacterial Ig-like domain